MRATDSGTVDEYCADLDRRSPARGDESRLTSVRLLSAHVESGCRSINPKAQTPTPIPTHTSHAPQRHRGTEKQFLSLCLCASVATSSLESGGEVELNNPAGPGPLERTGEVQLSDRVAEQVCAQRETCRRDALARAAEERRLLTAVPRHATIGE